MDYVRAAAHANTNPPTAAIEKHFYYEPEHSPADLEFTFVDALSNPSTLTEACLNGMRVRYEEIWMAKLRASLNVKRQARFSFTGYSRARDPAALDDLPTQ